MLKLFAVAGAPGGSAVQARYRREEGQTMAEYGVVLAVITPAIIATFSLFSESVRNTIASVAGLLPG